MKYTLEKNDKYTLFQLHEEKLTSLVAPDLKTELVKLNAEGTANIILDLGDVKYTDSSGLSSILVGNRVCQNDNGTFVLTRLSDHVNKLIQISQLDTILNITPTVEEAIDLVFMNSLENDLRKEGEDE
ncbi:MAG TPA: STAS domain-containing protein [Cytophagaceae bacterium]|jgi:anti-sigma B factor antagonist|nr:STAS domain-containing protein [Cytophagaceae bacterium]